MNILKALKIECEKSVNRNDYYKSAAGRGYTDKWYLGIGAFTTDIAKQLSDEHPTITVSKVRYHLKKLEAEGRAVSRSCPGGLSRWWPTGYRPEIDSTISKG